MNRKVAIMNKESGEIVSVDEINVSGLNYEPSKSEWFDAAWENAVGDELVNDGDRASYTISFCD